MSIKEAVDEKQAIKKRLSSARILSRSKELITTKELSDSQSPSSATKYADNTPSSFATSNLESLSAFTSVRRQDNVVPKSQYVHLRLRTRNIMLFLTIQTKNPPMGRIL